MAPAATEVVLGRDPQRPLDSIVLVIVLGLALLSGGSAARNPMVVVRSANDDPSRSARAASLLFGACPTQQPGTSNGALPDRTHEGLTHDREESPQGGGAPAVHTDANGWPLPAAESTQAPKQQPAPAATTPGPPPPAVPTQAPAASPGAGAELQIDPVDPSRAVLQLDAVAPPPSTPPSTPAPPASLAADSLQSPLRDVWRAIGQPASLADRGGARAEIALHVFDETGAEVGTRLLTHEADLSVPDRDRITFADGRRVYGRDGASVWALIDNVVWHAREDEARQLLDLLGLMLRAPWVLGSGRYRVFPQEPVDVDGQPRVRIRIEARPSGEIELPGGGADRGASDRFALICDPQTMRPLELRYRLTDGVAPRRVQLLEYQQLPPDLQVPVRRVVTTEDGRRLLEIEILRMECGLDLGAERFRPPVRGGWAGTPQ